MTLPFENDTSRIVKRLAKQNMKANRRTSISIMVAILIASTFLCSLYSTGSDGRYSVTVFHTKLSP